MSIDLRKRIVDLNKKAAFAANKHGIEEQRAQVALVLELYDRLLNEFPQWLMKAREKNLL